MLKVQSPSTSDHTPVDRIWLSSILATILAFLLYWSSAAPGISWAHQGADSGELLTAALTNGVPHPPGYPLYMMLLQGWLTVGRWLAPTVSSAWLGNLFSVVCAALSIGVTARVVGALLMPSSNRWLWALCASLAWAVTPLLWAQAVITEVYALHALFFTLLAWAIFVKQGRLPFLAPVIACGIAHHLTFVLLLPAVLYYNWAAQRPAKGTTKALFHALVPLVVGGVIGLLFHLRTPWAAAMLPPSPVNWGYPDNWEGFWWLASGAAYRGYLFATSSGTTFGRIAAWAYTLTSQYTPIGLALALFGLSLWDRSRPTLRNFSLIWMLLVSIYSIGYYTRDSEIYLLPVSWIMALWIGVGLQEGSGWLQLRWTHLPWQRISGGAVLLLLTLLVIIRWPTLSLRTDQAAERFVDEAAAVLEPHSIVISLEDAQTFALWYGTWGSGEILQQAPDLVLVNYSLLQFDWYRRLLKTLYPTVVGDAQSVDEILTANAGQRPVFLSEQLDFVPAESLQPIGPLWRYEPK